MEWFKEENGVMKAKKDVSLDVEEGHGAQELETLSLQRNHLSLLQPTRQLTLLHCHL
jgi:hypothetical protein